MGVAGFITAVVFLTLQIWGTLRLAESLPTRSTEYVIVMLGIIVALVALAGIAFDARWGWPGMLLVFSGSTANLSWLYVQRSISLTIGLSLFIAALSILVALVAADLWQPPTAPSPKATTETAKPERKKKTKKSRK